MDIGAIVTTGISAIIAVVLGVKKIRKWNRENRKAVIAPDNKRLHSRFVERMRNRVRGGKGKPAEEGGE